MKDTLGCCSLMYIYSPRPCPISYAFYQLIYRSKRHTVSFGVEDQYPTRDCEFPTMAMANWLCEIHLGMKYSNFPVLGIWRDARPLVMTACEILRGSSATSMLGHPQECEMHKATEAVASFVITVILRELQFNHAEPTIFYLLSMRFPNPTRSLVDTTPT